MYMYDLYKTELTIPMKVTFGYDYYNKQVANHLILANLHNQVVPYTTA